jgi:hypothetical protein
MSSKGTFEDSPTRIPTQNNMFANVFIPMKPTVDSIYYFTEILS